MRCATPILSSMLVALATAGAAQTQGETGADGAAPGLSIELNAAESGPAGCTLSFMVTNDHSGDITKAVYETVLLDAAGQVDKLTLFDFGALPAGRPRVRQFTLADTDCAGIGRILLNGANTCDSDDVGPAACTDALRLTSRTDIEVMG